MTASNGAFAPLDDWAQIGDREADQLHKVLEGKHRNVAPVAAPSAEFTDGEDLSGGAASAGASAPGEGRIVIHGLLRVELLHFGTTYRDLRARFAHGPLDDHQVMPFPEGHGIVHRAALQRESLLLASFLYGHLRALKDAEDAQGALGVAMGALGDLLGGGRGGADKARASDLDPYLSRVTAIGDAVGADMIAYDVLHGAGRDLQQLRADYGAFLQRAEAALRSQPETTGLLASLPMIGPLLPKEVGRFFTCVEKLATKGFDVQTGLVLGFTRLMSPVVERACRDMTVDAIAAKRTPIYPVWYDPAALAPQPPAGKLVEPRRPPVDTGGLLDSVFADAVKPLNDVGDAAVDNAVVDFLSRPKRETPGGRFLDQAFAVLRAPAAAKPKPAAGGIALQAQGSNLLSARREQEAVAAVQQHTGLTRVATEAVSFALGFPLPTFVETLLTHVVRADANFLRAVYGTLGTMTGAEPIVVRELVASGRRELVDQLIEAVLQASEWLTDVRQGLGASLAIGGLARHFSVDRFLQQAKELLQDELLRPHLDPIVEQAMKNLGGALEKVRLRLYPRDAMSMEAYLGLMPYELALLVKDSFFPVWDLLVDLVFKPLSDAINPLNQAVASYAGDGRRLADSARTYISKAQKINQWASGVTYVLGDDLRGPSLGPDVVGAGPDALPPAADFPVFQRSRKGTAPVIDDATYAAVKPMWRGKR